MTETGQHLIGQIKGKNNQQSTCKLLSTINNEQNREAVILFFSNDYNLQTSNVKVNHIWLNAFHTMDHPWLDKPKMLFLSFVFVIFVIYFQFS